MKRLLNKLLIENTSRELRMIRFIMLIAVLLTFTAMACEGQGTREAAHEIRIVGNLLARLG